MNSIKVSIIVPVYKTEPYLRKCLDSLINQTLREIEVICINDCSPDNSLTMLKEYEKKDDRVKIIDFKKNKGVQAARNTGMSIAKGEYIGFCDSDDYIDLDFYRKLYEKAKEAEADIAYSNIKHKGINCVKEYILFPYRKGCIAENLNIFWQCIYKTHMLRSNKIEFPLEIIQSGEDHCFLIKALIFANKVEYIHDAFYHYIVNSNSSIERIQSIESFHQLPGFFIIKLLNSNKVTHEFYIKQFTTFFYRFVHLYHKFATESQPLVVQGFAQYCAMCKYPEVFKDIHSFIDVSGYIERNAFEELFFRFRDRAEKNVYKQISIEPHTLDTRKLYIWGAGEDALSALMQCDTNGWKVEAFIDSNPNLKKFQEYKTLQPQHLLGYKNRDFFIVISSRNYANEISKICKDSGLKEGKDFWKPTLSMASGAENIIVFGAGMWGKTALEHYGEKSVAFFCDNNNDRVGQTYCGKKIISFEQLKKIPSGYKIVIAIGNFYQVANQLYESGIENHVNFFADSKGTKYARENNKEKKPICIEIKENKMLANYVKNKKLLSDYPYLFGKIPEFKALEKQILNLDEETPYFFKDLSKPLFISNLSHIVHIKFLFDNVRASEDVTMDNHIYLYYANEQKFLEMLCKCDMKPLLKQQKFVFLLGKQNKNIYPIDFKKRYGIDYESMPFKPLRANELKRIVIYNGLTVSGQDFLFQICAANKSILPIFVPELFSFLPKLENELLKFKFNINDLFCCRDIQRSVIYYYSLSNPDIFRFISMILYNNRERKNKIRISPTILLDPHHDKHFQFQNVYKSFPYRKGMRLIRNPITRFASLIKYKFFQSEAHYFFSNLYSCNPAFFVESGKFSCFKLESLKNKPIEGAKTLCKYLQVPFDKNMLHPEKYSYIASCCGSTGKMVMGFGPTPKRNIFDAISEWDLQRLTPLFEPILQHYGYEYKKYAPMQEKKLRKIYSEPFLFEKEMKVADRDFLTEVMLYFYNLVKNSDYYLPPLIDVD
jgi:glycosyltransferase involved in cell wall biosynthesis